MMRRVMQGYDWQKAVVFFSGQTNIPWLRFLKKGFRHCFVALYKNGEWVIIDPMAHRIEISVLKEEEGFNLVHWYKENGMTAVGVNVSPVICEKASLGILSCVEITKRILGIKEKGIYSPYSLYKFLINKNTGKKSLTNEND